MVDLLPGFDSARSIANWISESPIITDPMAKERAKAAFIDTIACMLAACDDIATQTVFKAVKYSGQGACSAIGRTETLSAESAALLNGTAAHALDYDDNFLPAVTHASAVLVPSLLSLGEEVGASGNQLLDAYIVGLEVQAWLGRFMIPAHYAAGWHATSTIGTIGAAAACVRVLTLDDQSALGAVSLATSMASGSKLQFGSMAKPLHAGLAARAGITAARLAAAGVNANEDPFHGPWGFISLHHASQTPTNAPSGQLAIIEAGLAQKRWPCCASAHRTLDAIFQLRQENDLDPHQIDYIETTIPDSNVKNLRFDNPENENEARFSMPYCAALVALNGKMSLSDFTPSAVRRPEVKAFLPKIRMNSAGPQSDFGTGIWDIPAETRITTKQGDVFEKIISHPVGTIHHPMGENELYQKFSECAASLLSPEQTDEFYTRLLNFENEPVRHIASHLRRREVPSTVN
ncbi:MmgE/PrpD family protein [Sneathiella aquimaris]|uniref:MmgE/PrpD family protein n=1 Tax=Sneathiella aquimaris TaxID=2599305 RepID=UPI00146AC271|nr:MmgE/PrpD family protein [Sneathiella aquimaris]